MAADTAHLLAPISGRPLLLGYQHHEGQDFMGEEEEDWILTLPAKMAAIQYQNLHLLELVQEQSKTISVLSQEVEGFISSRRLDNNNATPPTGARVQVGEQQPVPPPSSIPPTPPSQISSLNQSTSVVSASTAVVRDRTVPVAITPTNNDQQVTVTASTSTTNVVAPPQTIHHEVPKISPRPQPTASLVTAGGGLSASSAAAAGGVGAEQQPSIDKEEVAAVEHISIINQLLEMGFVRKDIEAALESLQQEKQQQGRTMNLQDVIDRIYADQEVVEVTKTSMQTNNTNNNSAVQPQISQQKQGENNKKKNKKSKKANNNNNNNNNNTKKRTSATTLVVGGGGGIPKASSPQHNAMNAGSKSVVEEDEIERLSREAEERAKRERLLERQERERQEKLQKEEEEKKEPAYDPPASSTSSSSSTVVQTPAPSSSSRQIQFPRSSINTQVEKKSSVSIGSSTESTTSMIKKIPTHKPKTTKNRMQNTVQVQPNQLSKFLYPTATKPSSTSSTSKSSVNNKTAINPIFEFMEDPSSIVLARRLLKLEHKISKQIYEYKGKCRAKKDLEKKLEKWEKEKDGLNEDRDLKIGRLEKQFKVAQEKFNKEPARHSLEAKLEELKKKNYTPNVKDNIKGTKESLAVLDDYEKKKVEIPKQIEKLKSDTVSRHEKLEKDIEEGKGELKKLEGVIKVKEKLVERSREEITKWKGAGQVEDSNFNIDESRNDHGLSFLHICAINNDVETANTILELGANVDIECPSSVTALSYAKMLFNDAISQLLREHGGKDSLEETWNHLDAAVDGKSLHRVDWETQLRIAERAAIPADTKMSSDEFDPSLHSIEDDSKVSGYDGWCFDASLVDPNSCNFRRIALLESAVFHWFTEAEKAQKSNLVDLIEKMRNSFPPISYHRKFIVGVKRDKQFAIYCASLAQKKANSGKPAKVASDDFVCFYSPYIESYLDGIANVGVLIWAVTTENQALKYKQLIEGAEFRRHKVHDADDRWPDHRDYVLELGKDMHLLDLMATSIFSGKAMELLRLDLDDNDLERLSLSGLGQRQFQPKKRLLQQEQHLANAIFRASKEESKEHSGLIEDSLPDKSTNISGGAGTGKTLTMIKKLVSEEPSKRIVVVSRLPRLVSFVKSTVQEERDISNIDFFTYDELLTSMVRAITPIDPDQERTFSAFSHVAFVDTSSIGGAATNISFEGEFVQCFLQPGEREKMVRNSIKPETLWEAFRIIKSSAQSAKTKAPLTQEQYTSLPITYRLTGTQRAIVYDLYERYEEWMTSGSFKWDEADRVLYVFRHGATVFTADEIVPWTRRAYDYGESDLLDDDDLPLAPFFYHMVFADEAQDFTELDVSLFIRMASSVRCLFLGADPAQSVEIGVRMRKGTLNRVFHASLPEHQKHIKVKDVMQDLTLKTNHRTHAKNLAIGKSIRKILTCTYGVEGSDENALMEGPIPEGLRLTSIKLLAENKTFVGGNVVFVAPDEIVSHVRSAFLHLNIKNDVFGVREAKGLEFSSVAIFGFFSYFEQVGSSKPWENVMQCVSPTVTGGKILESLADYALSYPEIEDQAMMLYTAVTRCKGHLYFIEVESGLGVGNKKDKTKRVKKKGPGLAEFAFRQFKNVGQLKLVTSINDGSQDMTPQQHKARGVLLVTQAINMAHGGADFVSVRRKFEEAADRFLPDKGNDQQLLEQCQKHREAFINKRRIRDRAKESFFQNGQYDLRGRFVEILQFEKAVAQFLKMCENDSFLVDEIQEVRVLCEEVFYGTPYEPHFARICNQMKRMEG